MIISVNEDDGMRFSSIEALSLKHFGLSYIFSLYDRHYEEDEWRRREGGDKPSNLTKLLMSFGGHLESFSFSVESLSKVSGFI